jgi:phosphatidate cytidylyltransferase
MLKTRILTAIGLLGIFLPALFYLPNIWWAFVMLGLALLALKEWAGLIKLTETQTLIYLVLAALVGAHFKQSITQYGLHPFFYNALFLFLLSAIFWLLFAPIWLLKSFKMPKIVLAFLGLLLIGAFWAALICLRAIDATLLLSLMATIWIADSAAYFAGKKFGKHKLAPSISPGKTWEGVAGALVGVTIFATIIVLGFGYHDLLIFPLFWAVAILGVMGDLFESMLKRQAGVKDSGNILPGHGGVLDRIDGLIPALPVAVILIYFTQILRVT